MSKLAEKGESYEGVILGGDWNAHHQLWEGDARSQSNDAAGSAIIEFLYDNDDLRLIRTKKPTYRGNTTIDFFILSRSLLNEGSTIGVGPETTDHSFLIMKINRADVERLEKKEAFVYKNVYWEDFREVATQELAGIRVDKHRNLRNEEIDQLIQDVSGKVRRTMERCIRKREVRIGVTDPLPEEIELLFKKRRNALKEKRRGRDNGNIGWTNMMNSVVKETTAEINKRLQAFENERMETKLKAIPENCDAFKVVKQLTGEKSKKAEDCQFVVNGRRIDSLEGKAKVMKEYYMELYKESTPTNELQPVIEEANEKAARWKSGITFSKDNSSLNPAESK